jgi:hypothetical protein
VKRTSPEFAYVSKRAATPGMARMGYMNRAGGALRACKSLKMAIKGICAFIESAFIADSWERSRLPTQLW